MRNLFIKELTKHSSKKRNIYLIINDLGYNVVEPFQKKFPKKFFNAGVSEQNMMGMAAGLSSEKNHVFVYSIANFPTFRCAEQIRNDIDYHKLPVTIVSVGAGLGYGHLGYTHHALQDYSLMRIFPNMLIVSPGNNNELINSLNYLVNNPQPSYLRIDKDSQKDLFFNKEKIMPGKLIRLSSGNKKKVILVTGSVQDLAKKLLIRKFKGYSLYSMPIWGMKVKNKVKETLKGFNEVVTVEDHFYDGGFGSWIQEIANNLNSNIKIKPHFIKDNVLYKVGSKDYLLNLYGPK